VGRFLLIAVLYATHGKQARLIAAVPDGELVVVVHVPVVGEVAIVLATAPPVADVADKVERTARIAKAARQGRKAEVICAVAATTPAICSLQLGTGVQALTKMTLTKITIVLA